MKNIEIQPQHFDINGVRYNKFEDIPERYRKFLDKDNNGMIDMLEQPVFNTNEKIKSNQHIQENQMHPIDYVSEKKRIALLVILIALGAILYQRFF